MSKLRRIFNFDFDNFAETTIVAFLNQSPWSRSIASGGVLMVKPSGYVLLIKNTHPNWTLLDDLGGRTELSDQSIWDTIIREVEEESNGLINLAQSVLQQSPQVYVPASKYLCCLIKVDDHEYNDTSIFGEREIADNILRTLHWMKYDDQLQQKMSHRLQSQDIIKEIKKIFLLQ